MKYLKYYTHSELETLYSSRNGEQKIGDSLEIIGNKDGLKNSFSKYVLLGIPEDIGVKLNYGREGTRHFWNEFLRAFFSMQNNRYLDLKKIALLGKLDFEDLYYELNLSKSNDLVNKIDKRVEKIVEEIVNAEKIPIIIGGGHNNSYPIIKAISKQIKKSIEIVNIDAHTDFRALEGRHSGNGFSYAYKEGYIFKYHVFGLQEAYTPEYIFNIIDNNRNISYNTYKNIRNRCSVSKCFLEDLENLGIENFGLEIDMDSVAFFPSSAFSPIGFNLDEIAECIDIVKSKNILYLHICESHNSRNETLWCGKSVSYLISQLIHKNSSIGT